MHPYPKEKSRALLHEWRVAAERMYRRFLKLACHEDQTLVITDLRCNGHITNGAAFERCVRLPAALKGARLAGLGSAKNLKLFDSVSEECIELVESTILLRAHESKNFGQQAGKAATISAAGVAMMGIICLF